MRAVSCRCVTAMIQSSFATANRFILFGADGDKHELAHADRAVAPDAGCANTGDADVTHFQGGVNNAEARLDEPSAAAPAAVAVDPGVTNTNTNACEGAPVDSGARDGSGVEGTKGSRDIGAASAPVRATVT
eukprot:1527043-Pleurochrysis_carterae.AAC.2